MARFFGVAIAFLILGVLNAAAFNFDDALNNQERSARRAWLLSILKILGGLSLAVGFVAFALMVYLTCTDHPVNIPPVELSLPAYDTQMIRYPRCKKKDFRFRRNAVNPRHRNQFLMATVYPTFCDGRPYIRDRKLGDVSE